MVVVDQQMQRWFIPDIGHIGAPLQVLGDRVKVYKESREKQHWDGCDGPNKCCYLCGAEDRLKLFYSGVSGISKKPSLLFI